MANKFKGTGNLGADPVLTSVGEDKRQVADLRIYFDRPIKNQDSGEYEDKGGFWLNVSVWDKLAEDVDRVLKKGMRVSVQGSLKQNVWDDVKSGEEKSKFVLYADEITLTLFRIESVKRRPTQPKNNHE